MVLRQRFASTTGPAKESVFGLISAVVLVSYLVGCTILTFSGPSGGDAVVALLPPLGLGSIGLAIIGCKDPAKRRLTAKCVLSFWATVWALAAPLVAGTALFDQAPQGEPPSLPTALSESIGVWLVAGLVSCLGVWALWTIWTKVPTNPPKLQWKE